MSKFTAIFANEALSEANQIMEDGKLLDDYRWIKLMEIAVIFGKTEGRNYLLDKSEENNMKLCYSESMDNKDNFSLFAKYRIGNGINIDIKESNKYLKKCISEGDEVGLLYKATIEEVRGNISTAMNYLAVGGDSGLLQLKLEQLKKTPSNYTESYKEIVQALYKNK